MICIRSDAEKQAEQIRISADYQNGVNSRRQKAHGVVVTPVEVVDFILRSCIEQVNAKGKEIDDDGVEWLDPFAGTGIFIARLLQIAPLTPERKYALAQNCIVIEIDPDAARLCFINLARVHLEETGRVGFVRVLCADTFALDSDYDFWEDRYGYPGVVHVQKGGNND